MNNDCCNNSKPSCGNNTPPTPPNPKCGNAKNTKPSQEKEDFNICYAMPHYMDYFKSLKQEFLPPPCNPALIKLRYLIPDICQTNEPQTSPEAQAPAPSSIPEPAGQSKCACGSRNDSPSLKKSLDCDQNKPQSSVPAQQCDGTQQKIEKKDCCNPQSLPSPLSGTECACISEKKSNKCGAGEKNETETTCGKQQNKELKNCCNPNGNAPIPPPSEPSCVELKTTEEKDCCNPQKNLPPPQLPPSGVSCAEEKKTEQKDCCNPPSPSPPSCGKQEKTDEKECCGPQKYLLPPSLPLSEPSCGEQQKTEEKDCCSPQLAQKCSGQDQIKQKDCSCPQQSPSVAQKCSGQEQIKQKDCTCAQQSPSAALKCSGQEEKKQKDCCGSQRDTSPMDGQYSPFCHYPSQDSNVQGFANIEKYTPYSINEPSGWLGGTEAPAQYDQFMGSVYNQCHGNMGPYNMPTSGSFYSSYSFSSNPGYMFPNQQTHYGYAGINQEVKPLESKWNATTSGKLQMEDYLKERRSFLQNRNHKKNNYDNISESVPMNMSLNLSKLQCKRNRELLLRNLKTIEDTSYDIRPEVIAAIVQMQEKRNLRTPAKVYDSIFCDDLHDQLSVHVANVGHLSHDMVPLSTKNLMNRNRLGISEDAAMLDSPYSIQVMKRFSK